MNSILHRKTFISMIFVGLTLLGIISYKNLRVELYPGIEFPVLTIRINSTTEVEPSYMENKGIIPLEGAVGTLENIDKIESTANRRNGTIYVTYNENADIKYAYLKLQEKIDQVSSALPEEFNVSIERNNLEDANNYLMQLQALGSGGIDRLRNIVDDEIVPNLENIDGIAGVIVYGGRKKSIKVILNIEACKSHGITISQVRGRLRSNNLEKVFAGTVNEKDKQYFVNVVAEYDDISNIYNIIIKEDGNIRLKDIADINFDYQEETSKSRVNGKDAVGIILIKDAQSNLIELSRETQAEIKKINKKYKHLDVELTIKFNTAEILEKNLDQIINLAIIGGILAIIVLWIFLKNLRLISVIALAIPISIYASFNLFYAFNITINFLTLIGIVLAIGMLLDNSIVVLENIYRLASQDKGADFSTVNGTKEVTRSIIAATLTTIAVFIGFLFISNINVKLLGYNIAVSIISSLTLSLLVALFLIPMITHRILKRHRKKSILFFKDISIRNILINRYIIILKACLRRPAFTIIGAICLFFITIAICLAVSINSNKEAETDEFSLFITMPSGSTLDKTDIQIAEIEDKLKDIEEKEDVISNINEEDAEITIKLKEKYKEINDRTFAEIKEDAIDRAKAVAGNIDISFEQTNTGSGRMGSQSSGGGAAGIFGATEPAKKVVVKGEDFETMKSVSENIKDILDELTSVRSANTTIRDNRPEMHLYFDPQFISSYNVSLNNIASELNSFQNEFSSYTSFKQGLDEYDIIITTDDVVKDEEKAQKTYADLAKLNIISDSGGIFELQDLSKIYYSTGLSQINRINQEKQIEIYYRFYNEINDSKSALESAENEISEVISSLNLPSGIAVEITEEDTGIGDYKFLLITALILIYMILASIFESLSTPIVIIYSIPLAAIGSFVALIFTGNSLIDVYNLTGFLILLGIVVNNGIILIDYAKILKKRGYREKRALMMAGIARVRPIFITAITTIIALIPLAMGRNEYVAILGAPFAITVIGGLALSTLLTLIIIPTFYSGLVSALNWHKKLDWKIKLTHFSLWIMIVWLALTRLDSLLWQLVSFHMAIILVPAITYFIQTSLRRASTTIIDEKEPIKINIQNLVKIYDRPSKFRYAWNNSKKLIKLGEEKDSYTWRDFDQLIWQIPLLGYLIYFTFVYLTKNFWMLSFSIITYFYMFYLIKPLYPYLKSVKQNNSRYLTIYNWFYKIFYWGFPLIALVFIYFNSDNLALAIVLAIGWYACLVIARASNKLYKEKINIHRLTGKWKGIRYFIYNLVMHIPVIGKKTIPFKALKAVSMEIGTGMFGLLGPNGAGKSTMMKIICGILEQSYGKIWINGFDTRFKREELQGLIGYLPQEFGMYENMTAYEYLNYQAILKDLVDKNKRENRIEDVLKEVNMVNHKHEKIGSFSGGMKQRVGIAQILLHLPRILVVDEPTAGLDPRERIRFRNLLIELSRDRIVLFSTHVIEDISSSCNKVAVLNKGEVRYLGNPRNMTEIAKGHVWQFYVPFNEFETIYHNHLVVHHMREGDKIKVRCVSKDKPVDDAVNVNPQLEDAYLWLQQN